MTLASAALFGLIFLAALEPLSGDQILRQAAVAPGLDSYSVPVHFDVHMHRPISLKTTVEGIAYYKAPANAALVITKMPGPLGKLFKGSYTLDMVPQAWPSKYTCPSVTNSKSGTADAYLLKCLPKNDPSIAGVDITVSQAGSVPLSAAWSYRDGSSIDLTIAGEHQTGFNLPGRENITVKMPQFSLDATAQYGTYNIHADVPDSIFH